MLDLPMPSAMCRSRRATRSTVTAGPRRGSTTSWRTSCSASSTCPRRTTRRATSACFRGHMASPPAPARAVASSTCAILQTTCAPASSMACSSNSGPPGTRRCSGRPMFQHHQKPTVEHCSPGNAPRLGDWADNSLDEAGCPQASGATQATGRLLPCGRCCGTTHANKAEQTARISLRRLGRGAACSPDRSSIIIVAADSGLVSQDLHRRCPRQRGPARGRAERQRPRAWQFVPCQFAGGGDVASAYPAQRLVSDLRGGLTALRPDARGDSLLLSNPIT